MLGGAQVDEKRHLKIKEAPIWMKYVTLPFALVAAPFKYAADGLRGEPEPGPELPQPEQQRQQRARRSPAPMDYETASLQNMERELAQRPPRKAPASGSAISDELAALHCDALVALSDDLLRLYGDDPEALRWSGFAHRSVAHRYNGQDRLKDALKMYHKSSELFERALMFREPRGQRGHLGMGRRIRAHDRL